MLFCFVLFQGGSSALLPKEVPAFPVVDSIVVMSRSIFYPVYTLLKLAILLNIHFVGLNFWAFLGDLFACVNCRVTPSDSLP